MQNQKAYDELKAAKEEEISDGKVIVRAPSQTFSMLLIVDADDEKKLEELKKYVDRMKEGQDDMYYITAENIAAVSSL